MPLLRNIYFMRLPSITLRVTLGALYLSYLVRLKLVAISYQLNLKIEDAYVSNEAFVGHQLRVVEPRICDPTVQQYSGYVDVANSKHLFFWYV
jgi:hypothetical protein